MKNKYRRSSGWLIALPAIFLAFFPNTAHADPAPGLQADGYNFDPNDGFPERDPDLYEPCGSEVENNINRNYEGEPFQDCGWDYFLLHYYGYLTIPENETISLMVAADDGGIVSVDGNEFGDWNLKGCSWSYPTNFPLTAGSYELDGWFYEWGGGTCFMLAWQIDGGDWEIVPDEAFTQQAVAPTTTIGETTTTEAETTTTSSSSTTVLETTTSSTTSTTLGETTSTSAPTTTNPTTTTQAPPTSQEQSAPPPSATPLPQSPEQTPASTETSASVPPPTVAPSSTGPTLPETSAPPPSQVATTEPTVPATQRPSRTTLAPRPTPTSEPKTPTGTSLPAVSAPQSSVATPSSTIQPPIPEPAPPSTQPLVPSGQDTQPTPLAPSVVQALQSPTVEQATQLATSPEVLQAINEEQADQLFATLEVTELSSTEIVALVAAVQSAPTKVRKSFEDKVDIFKAGLDDYVPTGSNIPVGERRTLVAAGGLIIAAGAATRIRR